VFFENLGRNKRLGSQQVRKRSWPLSNGLAKRPVRLSSTRCVVEASRRMSCLDRLRGDSELYGQANKRRRWMPWRSEAMKDVAACEKHGGAGNEH
jgi:hypothetical protein